MLSTVLAVALGAAIAWWSWRDRLQSPLARFAFAARAVAIAALLLLILDRGIASRRIDVRPLVLLDNSVSMHASGAAPIAAVAYARTVGEVVPFGELRTGEPGGHSSLATALNGALASGRPVTVVTDGEITDAADIPAEQLHRTAIHVMPRKSGADIALTEVRAPLRITAGDTLSIEVDAIRTPGSPDTATVTVRDSSVVLMHARLSFGAGNRASVRMTGVLPHGMIGEHWLAIARIGPADAEPLDDTRWWRIAVLPTPGVVVIAETPDWDSRALFRALTDVVAVPIRGYAQLQRGTWRRMDDLRIVPPAEVVTAARGADLLAVRGDTKNWSGMGHARLLWPTATEAGDWYVAGGSASPVSSAFAGIDGDSLPATAGVHRFPADSFRTWQGATARLARRGSAEPIIGGEQRANGRAILIGVDGLYRWPLHGGLADQAWRTLIANAATWLLATPTADSLRARPVDPVTQRGRPLHFRWTGLSAAVPTAIELKAGDVVTRDTLRFDGAGDATLALPVGQYRYHLEGGGTGLVGVEPFSDELLPSPVTVQEQASSAASAAPRRSLRELVWIFAIAIAGFGTEWMLRRRLGLR